MLTPRRIVGTEILDGPGVEPATRKLAMSDIARSNVVFGGRRAVLRELARALDDVGGARTLLDVGTGLGDIPRAACGIAADRGIALTAFGVDVAPSIIANARECLSHGVCGSALALPFADASIDFVTCSQVLHHFRGEDARRLIAEIDRVARHTVIVADLRRSWIAAAGFWIAAWPLRFHSITRHDGVISVLRGFTPPELAHIVRSVTGAQPTVQRRAGFRLTAVWHPLGSQDGIDAPPPVR